MHRLQHWLATTLRWLTWPALLAGGVGSTLVLKRGGMGEANAVLLVTGLVAAVLLVAQVVAGRARPDRAQLGTDILHMALSNGLVGAGVKVAAFAAVYGIAELTAAPLGGRLWPGDWSLFSQVVLALVLGELAFTTLHKLAHRRDWMWPWHAIHHSSPVMYVFAAGRNHPVNVIASYLAQVLPPMLLGARGEVLLLLSIFTTIHGMLQHTDLDLRTGWLSWVFATPAIHRIHHSVDMVEGNSNFGSNLVLWDMVFGTFRPPTTRPEEVGIAESVVPDGYWKQLAAPFRWRRLTSRST